MTDFQIERQLRFSPTFGDFARRLLNLFRRRTGALGPDLPEMWRQLLSRRPDCGGYNEAFVLQSWANYDPWR